MFLINTEKNVIHALAKKQFSEVGFKERQHLQEWLISNPECLGEKLLIIQKEFDEFNETYERLDLLALDKKGNLVIIENKLDDSGRDVTWQALKYASYCSTLTKEQIRNIFQSYLDVTSQGRNAVEALSEFFDGKEYSDMVLNQRMTQRLLLVAANFRKEVTSTALWLLNYKISIQCFKTNIYELSGQYFLTIEQIIPTKDAQDYVISMASKAQEELNVEDELMTRHKIRLEFWAALLTKIKGVSNLFQNSSPTKDHWLVAGGTNISGLSYQFVITQSSAAVALNFGRPSTDENKHLFDLLKSHQAQIESNFGDALNWDRLDGYKSSKVTYALPGANYYNRDEWPKIIQFLIDFINKLEIATKPYLSELKASLSKASITDTED